jgi:type IV pilus assembly protein PilW
MVQWLAGRLGVKKNKTFFLLFSKTSNGFTLVELMITVAISGIIIAAIYSAYITQHRTYLAQEQVAEMQQNNRAAIDMIAREIRMAGYDPTKAAGAGITIASVGQISFTQDTNGDTDTTDSGERIDIGFNVADDALRDGVPDNDLDGDGVPDAVSLRRQTYGPPPVFSPSGYQAIAENIQAIEFRYLDSTGAVTAVLADIRSVRISILARAGREDREFTNTMTYTPASGVPWDLNGAVAGNAPNDNFRRRLLITTVQCRNMGL